MNTPRPRDDAARVDGVQRIAVLRPNAVGDFVFALPALAALKATYPRATITLLGRRWHREFLAGRPGDVDEVIELPPIPGVGAPAEAACDAASVEAAVAALRARRFDIALQLYGGGAHSNPFVRRLGARVTAGACAADAEPLDRRIAYQPWQNERARLLEVVGLVGAAPVALAPPLVVTGDDEAQWRAVAPPGLAPGTPLAVLQPGATDPRRRWPAARFAAVGDALAEAGATVLVNGGADEAALVESVAGAMRRPAVALAGRLPLGGLLALLARARLLVSNDTGPLHLAGAVRTPSVGIYWFMNLLASAPLAADGQVPLFSARTRCPVCDRENLRERCPHEVSFVDDVALEEVRDAALAALRGAGGTTLTPQRASAAAAVPR